VRVARAALLLDECGHAANLEGALHLVERVAVVAHQLAGFRNIAELLSELQQGQFPSGTVAGGGHSVLQGFWRLAIPNYPFGPGGRRYASSATCRIITRLLHSGHGPALSTGARSSPERRGEPSSRFPGALRIGTALMTAVGSSS
jgi:hypothetical protein